MSYRKFEHAKIVGIAAAVPDNAVSNQNLSGEQSEIQKTAKLVGIKTRHIASENMCASDLCYAAAEKLLNELNWERSSVDALIFISQTSDYLFPATSCVLQNKLGLSQHCAAFDMSLGCSAYLYGLLVSFGLISKQGIRRVLLLVGDTISKVVSPDDMPANVLFGDAGTATAIEFDEAAKESFISVGTDGSGVHSLIIEAGGFRNPKTEKTNQRKPHFKDGVLRSEEELFMDGSAVFSFTLSKVPKAVKEILSISNNEINSIDYWLFHQANKFMLDYLIQKIGIAPEKMLMNIDRFGNTSPPSIPLLMVSERQMLKEKNSTRIGLVGFGVGFSWGAAILDVKNLVIPSLIFLKAE